MNRAALVDFAEASIARGSRSFAAASRLFEREMRERVWLLYAWCRAADDIIDGQDHGGAMAPVDDPATRIDRIRALTAAAFVGDATGEAAFDCLGVVAAETGLPPAYAFDLVDGFALDAEDWRPRTTDDLMRYCYHVAGAVGCMMAIVMGVRPDDHAVLDRACDLGLAFQLANIARDVREDAGAGRCYLPADWLEETGIEAAGLIDPALRERTALLTRRLARMARRYEASARAGTPALPYRAAWAVLAAAGIYGGIARKVEAAGAGALDRRVATSRAEKLGWVVRAGAQASARTSLYPPRLRPADLWRRPRR